MKVKRQGVAYLFVSPWLVGFIVFTAAPLVATVVLSFTKWGLLGSPIWVGVRNYAQMFRPGSDFWTVLKVTLLYTIGSVFVSVGWSLFTATLLNRKVRGTVLAGALYFAPAVTSVLALDFSFQLILGKELGIVNYILSFLGISGLNWLMDPKVVLWVVIFINIYAYYTGQMMLIFDSAIKQVPRELYEAADIDGAGAITKFLQVTLPAISPILLFNLVTATVSALTMSYTIVYPLTGGGPGLATQVISLDIYQNAFKLFRIGYACAEGVVVFVLSALVAIAYFKVAGKRVYYEV